MKIDMSKYRPFREMGKTCETREIKEKKVTWPDFGAVTLPDGRFRTRKIKRDEVEEVAEVWRRSYPEVYGSEYEFVLFPEEYEDKIALAETWDRDRTEKDCCVLVIEDIETDDLAGAFLMIKRDKNLEIEMSMLGVCPEYREKGIMRNIGEFGLRIDEMLEESGAEYLTGFLETWHDITQRSLIKQEGWKIAGIFPGHFTRWCGDQREYRACEVRMYKFIGDGEKHSTKPEEWNLAPEVKRVWDCLDEINREIEKKSTSK